MGGWTYDGVAECTQNRKGGPFADSMLPLQLPGTHKGKLSRQKILEQATLGPEMEDRKTPTRKGHDTGGGGEDNPHETTHLQEDGKTTDKRRNHGISSKWKGPPLQTSKT